MSVTVINRVTLLLGVLISTLVASASASEPSLRFLPQQDYDDFSYQDDETSCVKYCRSRMFGTYHCCPPPPVAYSDCTTQNVGCTGVSRGSQIDCTTHSVGCQERQPRIVYRPTKVTSVCGQPHCNPTTTVIQEDPPIYRNPVIYRDPVPVYTAPKYVCNNAICNPVRFRRPTVCPGPRCQRPPRLHVAPPSFGCNRPDLVEISDQLVIRSRARGYTKQNFIDGIQGIIDNNSQCSWNGQCTAPGQVVSAPDLEEVDIFGGRDIPTTNCRPCTTRTSGTRSCETRFQTVLGVCDRCCHSTRYRSTRSVANIHQDLREEVVQLLERAHTMQRNDFIDGLKAILRNDAKGRYSWNQTGLTSVQSHSKTPTVWDDSVNDYVSS